MKFLFLLMIVGGITTLNNEDAEHVVKEVVGLEEAVAAESQSMMSWPSTCSSPCASWTYQMGFDYGEMVSHWSDISFTNMYHYYMNTCGCTSYAVGLLEGYELAQFPEGEPQNNQHNPNGCMRFNPRTGQYEEC